VSVKKYLLVKRVLFFKGSSTQTAFYIHAVFNKNILYENIQDEIGQKVKNILRICHLEIVLKMLRIHLLQEY